ncbi:unnamed protein product [Symbiodinium sp. CCMP2592]|nr:unnamed protein product [Symbiodinium sp. CCMP2592]
MPEIRAALMPALWAQVFDFLLLQMPPDMSKQVGGISVFDGYARPDKSRISDQLTAASIPCYSLDSENHCKFDLLSEEGVLHFLRMLARMVPGSLLWLAPSCASWTGFISRASHGRSKEWMQGKCTAWTLHGDACASFCARAILAAASRGMYFVMENPAGSFIFDQEEIKNALASVGAVRVHVHLSGYGGYSSKPLWLYGNAPWLWRLSLDSQRRNRLLRKRALPLPENQGRLSHHYEDGAVRGDAAKLCESQAYPLQFSATVADLHRAHVNSS